MGSEMCIRDSHDPFCVCADFSDYCDAQDRVSSAWKERDNWTRRSLLNAAKSGFFSSDRSIRDYCEKIWGIDKPLIKVYNK